MKLLSLLRHLRQTLFCFSPAYVLLILSLMLIRSLTSGIGLLLAVPLLNLVGISTLGNGGDSIAHKLSMALTSLHVPIYLPSLLCVFVFVNMVLATVRFFEETCYAAWQERYQLHLRETLYRAIINTKWSYLNRIKRDEFLHGVTGQLHAALQYTYQVFHLTSQFILVGVYVALSMLISWKMTVGAAIVGGVLLSMMLPLHRIIAQSSQAFLQRSQMLFHIFYEQLAAIKMVKSCRAESTFIAKILAEGASLKNQTKRTNRAIASSKWLYSTGTAIIFGVMLYLAIAVWVLPLDTLILLLLIFSRLMPRISALQQTYQLLLRYFPAYAALKKLLQDCAIHEDERIHAPSVGINFQREIVLQDVSFGHDTVPVIERFSMCLQKNTTTMLSGPSGAGKTTLADLISGLLSPTLGTIWIDALALDDTSLPSWRQSVAYVMQDAHLFNTSIRENLLLFAPQTTEEMLWQVLTLVSAAAFVCNLEKGLDTVVGDRGTRLSGGERQRIVLARALLMNPQLLILDESTNALDKETVQCIQQALLKLRGKMTILIISHQSELAECADQVIQVQACVTGNMAATYFL